MTDLAVFTDNKTTKPSSHQANIVRITEILPHTNADKLEIIHFTGSSYQTVAQKGAFKVNDLAVYIQPDSVVPQTEPFRFIWGEKYDEAAARPYTAPESAIGESKIFVTERSRRITVKKLRGEYSEGLLMPTTDFFNHTWYGTSLIAVAVNNDLSSYDMHYPGDDVSDVIGITHYEGDNDEGESSEFAPKFSVKAKKRRYPKTFKGWFFYLLAKVQRYVNAERGADLVENDLGLPVYDVESFRNHQNVFSPDETVLVTEKIHGSNARFIYVNGVVYAGSKNYWKAPDSNCIWRRALKANPWIEEWLIAHPGQALYGEVTPTQKGYDYGSKEPQFFVFDILRHDGLWEHKAGLLGGLLGEAAVLKLAPVLFYGRYEDFKPQELGTMTVVGGGKHISEGYVIASDTEQSARGLHRKQLKVKSNLFLEKEGKSK